MEALATFTLLSVVAVGTWLWSVVLRRMALGQPILPQEPRAKAPWGLVDVLLAVVLVFAIQVLIGLAIKVGAPQLLSEEGRNSTAGMTLSVGLASGSMFLAFLLSIAMTRLRTGATLLDLGYHWTAVRNDFVLGVAAFCMLAPLVFLIQFTLVNLWKPTQHPLILMLKDNPSPGLFAVASFAAVVVAPVVEEYFFRGLLQGWLESLTRRHTFEDILVGIPAKAASLPPSDIADKSAEVGDVENFSDPQAADADLAVNSYAPPVLTAEVLGDANEEDKPSEPHVPAWPMFVSAALFALAHYSHGPDWVPLFVLALGLGYLYQRTHRLVPCMTVHFLLNLASMGVLYLEVFLRVGASK